MNKTILIYANGSSSIGLGHIMRTLSIASELKKEDFNVTYLTDKSDKDALEIIKDRQLEIIEIKDINTFLNKNIENKYYGVIVDSYHIKEKNIKDFYNIAEKVIYIDDMNKFEEYNMDLIINYAVGAEKLIYKGRAKKLLGIKYIPIREEFSEITYKTPQKEVKDILITLGGGDEKNITGKLLNFLTKEYKNINFHVVLGNANQHKTELRNKYKLTNVYFYENVKNMSKLMIRCDFAISAGGSTIYELSACGIPTLAIITADNQERFIKEMNNTINMPYENFINCKEENIKNLKKKIQKVMTNWHYRKNISYDMYNLVDKKGVKRIVKSIILKFKGTVKQFKLKLLYEFTIIL